MNTLERALIEKAACEHGWENVLESHAEAIVLASARHRARVRITPLPASPDLRIEAPPGLIRQELARTFPEFIAKEGIIAAGNIDKLSSILRRTAELAKSLPDQAALSYRAAVARELGNIETCATEVERLVKQRVGQETFRQALMDYWGGACAVTGMDLPEVLRASHAKPWANCCSDKERLNVFNGLLLIANLDSLFDRGLISFDEAGRLICSPCLGPGQRQRLSLIDNLYLRWLASEHAYYLSWHRQYVFHSP